MSSVNSAASQSHPSDFVSNHIGKSMIWSDSGLSLFDYPLDRQNRDVILSLLTDLSFKIVAVWVVARPLSGFKNTTYEHWCVKIQAPPALLSMDWLESKKKGQFGLQQTTATDAELEDFLHYYVHDENGKRRKKWQIVSSVTPSPLKNTSYLKYIDDHDLKKLKAFMTKNYKHTNYSYDSQCVQHINIKKKICDIADFVCFIKHKYKNEQVQWVKQFSWKLVGDRFIQLKTGATNKWIYSKKLYNVCIDDEHDENPKIINFYFGCRAMYVSGIKQCELYIFIKSVNCESIDQISIGYDRLCRECDYHSYMHSEWIKLNLKHKVASHGGKTFDLSAVKLNKLSSITWTVGIKIIDIMYV